MGFINRCSAGERLRLGARYHYQCLHRILIDNAHQNMAYLVKSASIPKCMQKSTKRSLLSFFCDSTIMSINNRI